MQLEVRGIVARSVRYGEATRIITLITRERGKITVSAKGSQSAKSRHLASLQLFSKSDFRLSESQRSKRLTVSSSRLLDSHSGLALSLEKMAAASYAVEALEEALAEGEADLLSYRLLNVALALFEKADEGRIPLAALSFLLKALGVLGIAPHFGGCAACGKSAGRYAFSFASGGALCPECSAGSADGWISDAEAAYMGALLQVGFAEILELELAPQGQVARLFSMLNRYYTYSFSKSLKSYESLALAMGEKNDS